jgi:hypothetical protein
MSPSMPNTAGAASMLPGSSTTPRTRRRVGVEYSWVRFKAALGKSWGKPTFPNGPEPTQ